MGSMKTNVLKLISSARSIRMGIGNVLFGIIIVVLLTSCNRITTGTAIATPGTPTQQPEPFRPEPQEPHIFVSFSGLDESAIGYVYFRTFSGHVPVWGSRPGNGDKRVVLPEHQGEVYIVTAEAEGYLSNPISYTIQLSDDIFYLVKDGQITTIEATNLKFQFEPIFTPTSD